RGSLEAQSGQAVAREVKLLVGLRFLAVVAPAEHPNAVTPFLMTPRTQPVHNEPRRGELRTVSPGDPHSVAPVLVSHQVDIIRSKMRNQTGEESVLRGTADLVA